MAASEIDRGDPAVRAELALRAAEQAHRARRRFAGLLLAAVAVAGPFAAAPFTGGPGATIGAIVASVLCAGCAVVVWPWRWSPAEREHHRLAALWAQARPDTDAVTPWDRHAAWAQERDDVVEVVLVTRAGSGAPLAVAVPRGRTRDVRGRGGPRGAPRRWSASAARPPSARARPTSAISRRSPPPRASPTTTPCGASTTDAAAAQRRAEAQMRQELAREEAAERRAQAAAVARALRRP